jgi:site-specific recombinase XerD
MNLVKRSNGRYYITYIQSNGKKNGISTRTKIKAEALKFLSQFEREMEARRLQKLIPISLKEYSNQFLSYSKQIHTQKTYRGYEAALNNLEKFLGGIPITEVTHSKLSEYFENRINTSSIYQARKDLICFNSCFNSAIAEGYILSNPCKSIKRFRLPQKEPVFFHEWEFDLLLSKIKENDIKDIVIFAVHTGLRQMELITLEWSQINFKDRFLVLTNHNHLTKSKKIRTVPLSIKAMQILTDREMKKKGNLIFTFNNKPINQNFISHLFKSYVRESGINPKLNFHSLRHTFASWLVQRGVSIYEVSKLLGHSNISVTEIYSHLRAEDLRSAINVLNN